MPNGTSQGFSLSEEMSAMAAIRASEHTAFSTGLRRLLYEMDTGSSRTHVDGAARGQITCDPVLLDKRERGDSGWDAVARAVASQMPQFRWPRERKHQSL
jgi:hypothetical protein